MPDLCKRHCMLKGQNYVATVANMLKMAKHEIYALITHWESNTHGTSNEARMACFNRASATDHHRVLRYEKENTATRD